MSACCGFGRKSVALGENDGEREPLLPRYNDETTLQARVHEKLHTYQMLRAISHGYMPSTQQVVLNLRTLLSCDLLNPNPSTLSDSGLAFTTYTKQWLRQFMDMLEHKNEHDQLQDFAWCVGHSRVSVDTRRIYQQATKVKAKADAAAAYQSLATVGSLLFTNSDFRMFISDIQSVGREVFKDSAFAISKAADDAGQKLDAMPPAPDMPGGSPIGKENSGIEKSSEDQNGGAKARRGSDILKEDLAQGQANGPQGEAPTNADLKKDVNDVSKIVGNEAAEVAKKTGQSVQEHFSGNEKEALISRLQNAVTKLRQRPDYDDSVSTISLLIKRYALVYSRAAKESVETLEDNVFENKEVDLAVKNFWSLLRGFGDSHEWDALETCFRRVVAHQQENPQFEQLMMQVGNAVQGILTNPESIRQADDTFAELRRKANESVGGTSIKKDVDKLLAQISRTFQAFIRDDDLSKMYHTSLMMFDVLSPKNKIKNDELIQDTINTFVPLLISAIQHVPIPRLEVSTPEIDLLLENLIIEPGSTVNQTSFLPFRFRAETHNDLEIRRTHTLSTVSHTKSLLTLKVDGLSMRADEVGYWLRLHSGIFRMQDEGIASFALDRRGVDIAIDIEISKPTTSLDTILSLRDVRVKIHKLNYALRRSSYSILAWLLKPLLRPILKRTLEAQIAQAIGDGLRAANRELVFARERLRATRVADPDDLVKFARAVMARMTPAPDPDLYTRVGVDSPDDPRRNVFAGVYAPGSVVRLWHDEARRAREHIEEWSRDGWRNDVFNLPDASVPIVEVSSPPNTAP